MLLIINSLFAIENNENQYYINIYLKIDNNTKYIKDLDNNEIFNIIENLFLDEHPSISLINKSIKINNLDLDRYFMNKLNHSKIKKLLKKINELNYFIHLVINDDQIILYLKDIKNKNLVQSFIRRKELLESPYLSIQDIKNILNNFLQKSVYRKVEINNLPYKNGNIFVNNFYYGKWRNKQDIVIEKVPKSIDSWFVLETNNKISNLMSITKIKSLNKKDNKVFSKISFRTKVSKPHFNFYTELEKNKNTDLDFDIILINIPKIWQYHHTTSLYNNNFKVGRYLCLYNEKNHSINMPKFLSLKDTIRFHPNEQTIDMYLDKKSKPVATFSNLIVPGIGSSYYFGNSYKNKSQRWNSLKYNLSTISYIGFFINSLYSYNKFTNHRDKYFNCKENYNKLDFNNTANEFLVLENCITQNFDSAYQYKNKYWTSIISTLIINTLFNYFYLSN
ncbi:MAG: hypothetical protein H8E55_26615 [Pelagibacterales bacterium]|nr:hypothetical protein [Pelagibacterales bacterium]